MSGLLELRNVTKVYSGGLFRRRSTVALRESCISIGEDHPTIVTIAGESGSGKTTMGMLMLGFIAPTSGEVLYRGQNLWKSPKPVWRQFRREVQAIFQDPFEVYNPFYRVDHVLTLPISKFKLAKSKAARQQMMEEALTRVGLRPSDTLGRYPHELSGGQRQRIAIARALLLDPKVIIADEPVSMVDASLRATILKSLQRLRDEMGISILYITHDLATAYHIGERIVVLYQGQVAEAGDVQSVITNPQHPYTQLLVSSIPWPDPNRKWGWIEASASTGVILATEGCAFAPRCPHVMDVCRKERPSLFRTGDTCAAACFLYQGSPVAEGSELTVVPGPGEICRPDGA